MNFLHLITCLLTLSSVAAEIPPDLFKGLTAETFLARQDAAKQVATWIKDGKNPSAKVNTILTTIRDTDHPQIHYSLKRLLKIYVIESSPMGFLGIGHQTSYLTINDVRTPCIKVSKAHPNTLASLIGILPGDLIIKVNDTPFITPTAEQAERGHSVSSHFSYLVKKNPPGEILKLKIHRGEQILTLSGKASSYKIYVKLLSQNEQKEIQTKIKGFTKLENIYFDYWWMEHYLEVLEKK